jgi:dihydroorotase
MGSDWTIRGGTVLDPGSGLDGPADVAVRDGEIVAIGPHLPTHEAAPEIDATGLLVLPGLIDLHTHVFRGATFWGIDPDPVAARSGVTTWVDAGSAGAIGLSGLREFVAERAGVSACCGWRKARSTPSTLTASVDGRREPFVRP